MKKTVRKILVANRGEIAVRIIRSCRELGLESVAIYSDADTESLHVKLADQAVRIGAGPATESYLRIERIIDAAEQTGADAVHPGYGLLSENAGFARAVRDAGLVFIGPSPEAIAAMGDKTEAKSRMRKAKVPVVPGSEGPVSDVEQGQEIAQEIGFPILIKAVAGGGGRGMRIVESKDKFTEAFESAAREAQGAFGDGRVYLEKYLKNPRHVEVQILADSKGNCVHLGERECSVQRRHQKIIEESPCVIVDEKLRAKMGKCAVDAALAVKYQSAGTVEFLVDSEKNFYFIEMNTRIQVEHPVTELCYGVDLVAQQIRIAQGEELPFSQSDLKPKGWAIECRICAEDPEKNYMPSPGEITGLRLPGGPGIRIDAAIYAGYTIPVFYDPMICKLIAWGEDRSVAIQRMVGALKEFQIQGVKTNLNLLRQILEEEDFQKGKLHINYLKEKALESSSGAKKRIGQNGHSLHLHDIAAIAAALSEFQKRHLSHDANGGKPKHRMLSAWKLSQTGWKWSGLRRAMDRMK